MCVTSRPSPFKEWVYVLLTPSLCRLDADDDMSLEPQDGVSRHAEKGQDEPGSRSGVYRVTKKHFVFGRLYILRYICRIPLACPLLTFACITSFNPLATVLRAPLLFYVTKEEARSQEIKQLV